MIILRKYLVYVFWSLACFSIILLGVYAFVQLSPDTSEASAVQLNNELKGIREGILYISLILAILQSAALLVILSSSRKTKRRAENLMQRKLWLSSEGDRWYKVLGELGQSFHTMNSELLQTNEARGIKIQALNRLTEFLVQNHGQPLCITNIKGEILYASPSFLEKTDAQRSQLINSYISQEFPGIHQGHIITAFQKDHGVYRAESARGNFSVYPVRDHRQEITYLVFTSGNKNYNPPKQDGGRTTVTEAEKNPGGGQVWLRKAFEKVLKRGGNRV